MIDLNQPVPPWPTDAAQLLHTCLAEAAGGAGWQTPEPAGAQELREALGRHLGVDAQQVVVASSVRAIAWVAASMTTVTVEHPTFRGVVKVIAAVRGPVTTASWDGLPEGGLPQALWVTSPARNPDGRTLTAAECQRLAGPGLVVQNEVYRLWRPSAPVVPGAWRVGSLSKIAGGGARLAWAVVADADAFTRHLPPGFGPPGPWQHAWALFLDRGGLTLAGRVVADVDAARTAFLGELAARLGCRVPEVAGPSVALAASRPTAPLIDDLAAGGVRVADGAKFLMPSPGLRVSFFGISPSDAARAAAIIADTGALSPVVFA